MSVDATSSRDDSTAIKPRSRVVPKVLLQDSTPEVPTLLRMPDLRPRPHAEHRREQATAAPKSTESAEQPITTESVEALPQRTASEDPSAERETITPLAAVLDRARGMTFPTVNGFANQWKGRVATLGTIAAAVIACTLVARAMRQDDFDDNPIQTSVAESAADPSSTEADQPPIEVVAANQGNGATTGPTDVSTAPVRNDDAFGEVAPPSVERLSIPEVTAPSSPEPLGAGPSPIARNDMELREATGGDEFGRPRHAARVPTSLESQAIVPSAVPALELNEPLPASPFGSVPEPSRDAPVDVPISGGPLDPGLFPSQPRQSDNPRIGPMSGADRQARPGPQAVPVAPTPHYPTTDPSEYVSLEEYRTALLHRKLERQRRPRIGDSRSSAPTQRPFGDGSRTGRFQSNQGTAYR